MRDIQGDKYNGKCKKDRLNAHMDNYDVSRKDLKRRVRPSRGKVLSYKSISVL